MKDIKEDITGGKIHYVRGLEESNYGKNVYPTQGNLQIQGNSLSMAFSTELKTNKNLKIFMEIVKTLNS